MNARDSILAQMRANLRGKEEVMRPSFVDNWTVYPDLIGQFVNACSELPATVVQAQGNEADAIVKLPIYQNSKVIRSFVENVPSTVDELTKPHDASILDLSIARGKVGVAESGAIWVDGNGIEPRSALFLAEHLVLVLSALDIVPHLHAAYERIAVGAHAFGAFIAGPSKTADIEQALVVGAHGPRSLTIVLMKGQTPQGTLAFANLPGE